MWLAPTTTDFSAGLGGVSSLARSSKLSNNDLVDQGNVDRYIEDIGGQFNLARCFALWGHYVY
jgi:hypothetical protein